MQPLPWRMALWIFYLILAPSLLAAALCTSMLFWNPAAAAAPKQLLVEIWSLGLASREYRGSVLRVVWLETVPVFALAPLAVGLLLPLIFLCLPDTRRVSRVRVSHVARGAAYGLACLVPVVMLRAFWLISTSLLVFADLQTRGRYRMDLYAVHKLISQGREGVLQASTIFFILIMCWVMAWWHAALRHGWRINEYNKVWWALMVSAWLIAAIAALVSTYGLQIF
jgi:hypothetical protein